MTQVSLPSRLELTSCIQSSLGRLRINGNGEDNTPMIGALAVAHEAWGNNIQQHDVDGAVDALTSDLIRNSNPILSATDFVADVHLAFKKCHSFVQTRNFFMSSLLWRIHNSQMSIAGIGWAFAWHSSGLKVKQVVDSTSVTISGCPPVLVASIGLGEVGESQQVLDVNLPDFSSVCFVISSPVACSHADCLINNAPTSGFQSDLHTAITRHEAMCIIKSI